MWPRTERHILPSLVWAIFILLCCAVWPTDGAKILVVPIPLRSLFNLGVQAGNALQQRGHEVWIMAPDGKQESFTQTGLHYLTYDVGPMYSFEDKLSTEMTGQLTEPDSVKGFNIFNKISDVVSANYLTCNNTLGNTQLINTIKEKHFDLAIMGTVQLLSCLYMIPYKFDIPYMAFSPIVEPWVAGVTAMPSFEPTPFSDPPVSHSMTFVDRIRNTLVYVIMPLAIRFINEGDYQSWFAPEKPMKSVMQLRSESLMWFIIVDNACLDYPRISAPHYHHIGALATATPKPLTGDLKPFVDGATYGLILATFGSTKMGATMMNILLPLLKQVSPKLKQRVLIQYTGPSDDKTVGFPANVLIQKWIPQNDILGHANTVAMVSHAGANGQMESVFHGVPTICIPFQQEQRYNCRRAVEHKFAVSLSLDDLTAEGLLAAITGITTDPSFKNHVTKCSRIIHSLPQGKDQLQFWVDHVLEFGADHLRPKSADMPFYSLFMLDVMAVFVVALVLVVAVFIWITRCMCRCIRGKPKIKAE